MVPFLPRLHVFAYIFFQYPAILIGLKGSIGLRVKDVLGFLVSVLYLPSLLKIITIHFKVTFTEVSTVPCRE